MPDIYDDSPAYPRGGIATNQRMLESQASNRLISENFGNAALQNYGYQSGVYEQCIQPRSYQGSQAAYNLEFTNCFPQNNVAYPVYGDPRLGGAYGQGCGAQYQQFGQNDGLRDIQQAQEEIREGELLMRINPRLGVELIRDGQNRLAEGQQDIAQEGYYPQGQYDSPCFSDSTLPVNNYGDYGAAGRYGTSLSLGIGLSWLNGRFGNYYENGENSCYNNQNIENNYYKNVTRNNYYGGHNRNDHDWDDWRYRRHPIDGPPYINPGRYPIDGPPVIHPMPPIHHPIGQPIYPMPPIHHPIGRPIYPIHPIGHPIQPIIYPLPPRIANSANQGASFSPERLYPQGNNGHEAFQGYAHQLAHAPAFQMRRRG